MKVLYVSGKYRDPRGAWFVQKNIERAADIAVELWQMGYAVICPHKNTAFMEGPIDDPTIIAGDCELVRRSDGLVIVPGWETSLGTREEMKVAMLANKPIFYWATDENRALRRWATGDYNIQEHLRRQYILTAVNDSPYFNQTRVSNEAQQGTGTWSI